MLRCAASAAAADSAGYCGCERRPSRSRKPVSIVASTNCGCSRICEQERDVGVDAEDRRSREARRWRGGARLRESRLDDQLGEHRVVVNRHLGARLHAAVDADARALRLAVQAGSGRPAGETPARVLGVDAALDRVAALRERLSCVKGSGSPAATRNCARTRSTPVTHSVTGCSTCRRVFISRK